MDFRRQCLSHCLSLLVPAFALLIPPGALTGLPSQAYRTFRYHAQGSVISSQRSRRGSPLGVEPLQHTRDLTIFISPFLACLLIGITQVRAIFHPDLHLVGRPNRHPQIALELGVRLSLLAKTFGNISANRFAGSPNLIGKAGILFDFRKLQRCLMQIQRKRYARWNTSRSSKEETLAFAAASTSRPLITDI